MGLFKKIKNKITNATTSAQQQGQKLIDRTNDKIRENLAKINLPSLSDIPFRVLIPFKQIMEDALKSRGIANNGTLSDIAIKFNNFIVTRNGMYNPVRPNGVNSNPNIKPFVGRQKPFMSGMHADGEAPTAGEYEEYSKQTMGIIQQILAWFKERKARKNAEEATAKSGQTPEQVDGSINTNPLTPEERDMIVKAEVTTKAIEEQAKKEVEAENDDEFSTVEIVVSLVVVSFVLYLIFKPKK